MVRRIGALPGVAVILLIAAACGSGDDGTAAEPAPEPSPPPEQTAAEWLDELSRAMGPIVADAQGQGVEIGTCLVREASEAVADYSECRSLVSDAQATLTTMRDVLNQVGQPPEAAAFSYDAFDQNIRDREEALDHVLTGLDADPTSLEGRWHFNQSDVLVRRAVGRSTAAALHASELAGDELPERIEEGFNINEVLFAEETYDPYQQADLEHLRAD